MKKTQVHSTWDAIQYLTGAALMSVGSGLVAGAIRGPVVGVGVGLLAAGLALIFEYTSDRRSS